jgi:AcrR family transcriptional regulator
MSDTEAIKGLRQAAKRRERAENARREATAELLRFIRQAQADGVSISRIAREAGLSRQGVYDLLAARPS